jgi:DNA invertase Pin-like site-specific DNA recombinase
MGRLPKWVTGGERKQQIMRLSLRHQRVLRLLAQGNSVNAVARATNYSRSTVSCVANSKVGRELLDKLSKDLFDDLFTWHREWLRETMNRKGKNKKL